MVPDVLNNKIAYSTLLRGHQRMSEYSYLYFDISEPSQERPLALYDL